MSEPSRPFPTRETTVDAFARHVSPGKVAAYRKYGIELIMGHREGAWFEDAFDGRRFLNCHCNGGVFNLGHRNPGVIAAVRTALDHLDIGNHHLVSTWRAELGRRLSATTNGRLSGVVFAVSGGEAVDLAIKVTRGVTGRTGIISASGGYHGHTGLALATGDPQYREPFGPNLPGFRQVPFDDVPALEEAIREDTAAVILEPIPATLGMPIPDPDYLMRVQALCRQRGARLILDEVQTGLARTGRIWCYQHDPRLEPDVVVTGKGLGGGIYPIAATLMTRELHAFFDDNPFVHISTFGGAELGCVAALAVLDAVESPGFMARVEAVSDRIGEALAPLPFTLRRRGLMMGIKLAVPDAGLMATRLLYDRGMFCVYANNDTSVLQLLPPLIISDDDVQFLVDTVRDAFGG